MTFADRGKHVVPVLVHLAITLYSVLCTLSPGQEHRENTQITKESSSVVLSKTVFSVSLTKKQGAQWDILLSPCQGFFCHNPTLNLT